MPKLQKFKCDILSYFQTMCKTLLSKHIIKWNIFGDFTIFQSISGCINGRFVSYFQKSWPHLVGQEKVKIFSLFFFPLFAPADIFFLYKVNSFVTWLIKYVKVRTTIFSSILSSPSLWWCLKAPGWQRHWRQLRWEFWQRESCLRPVGLSSFSFSSLYYFMAHSARFWARCKTCSSLTCMPWEKISILYIGELLPALYHFLSCQTYRDSKMWG